MCFILVLYKFALKYCNSIKKKKFYLYIDFQSCVYIILFTTDANILFLNLFHSYLKNSKLLQLVHY